MKLRKLRYGCPRSTSVNLSATISFGQYAPAVYIRIVSFQQYTSF